MRLNITNRYHLILIITLFIASSCESPKNTMELDGMKKQQANDPHSFAKPENAVIKHLSWSATVDFETRTISGTASYLIETDGKADTIIFDTQSLTIEKVTIGDNQEETHYELKEGSESEVLGTPLYVALANDTKKINIT